MIPPVLPTYARNELAFVRGEGPYLFTADQRRFLDFASGIAVTSLGHSHPHLVKTLQEQAARLWHTANLVHIPDQQRLAERLVARTFADTAFFCNSGAEALECAVKMARRYHSQGGPQNRYRVITFNGAFHGRTLATIAAGGQSKHLAGFAPAVDGFDHVPFGNLNALRDAIGADTAAILVEPVQGEGGIIPADASFLRGLRQAADEFGLLLIFDEVQTGMGRTGALFAYEHSGITPDIMAVAKGLGGGFPVAACLATERAASAMTTGTHGSTFGGNPLAMAVANAVLDVMEAEGFLDHVNHVASILRQGLADLASRYPTVIGEVRGLGLMLGLVLPAEVTNTTFIDQARRQGLLCVGAGHNAVRLLPPLIVEEAHIAESLGILDATCAALLPSEQRTVP